MHQVNRIASVLKDYSQHHNWVEREHQVPWLRYCRLGEAARVDNIIRHCCTAWCCLPSHQLLWRAPWVRRGVAQWIFSLQQFRDSAANLRARQCWHATESWHYPHIENVSKDLLNWCINCWKSLYKLISLLTATMGLIILDLHTCILRIITYILCVNSYTYLETAAHSMEI